MATNGIQIPMMNNGSGMLTSADSAVGDAIISSGVTSATQGVPTGAS